MNESVIVIVANDAYLPQAKSLMVNCRRQGNWKGDFCLLSGRDSNFFSLSERRISVLQVNSEDWTMLTKFHIFSNYFKQWDRLLCLDCDILIQGDLNDAVDGLSEQFPNILFDGSSDGSIVHNWEHFDKAHGEGREAHPALYDKMRERFPHIDKRILTADVICFDPHVIPDGTVQQLQSVAEEFREANRGRVDQPIYSLVLYDKMAPITKDYCTWFAFDYPGNRVVNEAKGWTGKEFPAIIHYWNMYAPWLVKTKDAGAYYNHRLDRVCHELWAENLAAFDEVFPIQR